MDLKVGDFALDSDTSILLALAGIIGLVIGFVVTVIYIRITAARPKEKQKSTPKSKSRRQRPSRVTRNYAVEESKTKDYDSDVATAAVTTLGPKLRCKNCRALLRPTAKYCDNCGARQF